MNEKRIAAMRVAKWYHILPIKTGMQLELHEHVWEGNNKRIWRFKWLVIAVKRPNHATWSFTIRWKVAGNTIEKIYPLSFPHFDKVMLLDQYKIRRAKLYYIREKVGKDARMKSELTQADKWIDLLKLAQEEIAALQQSLEETTQEENEKPLESNQQENASQENHQEANESDETTEQSVEDASQTSQEVEETVQQDPKEQEDQLEANPKDAADYSSDNDAEKTETK